MSFSQSVKKEILANVKRLKGCSATAFLTAVLKSVGSLNLDHNGYCFAVETDNADLLLLCSNVALADFGEEAYVYQVNAADRERRARYVARFDVSLGQKLGLICRNDNGVQLVEPSLPLDEPASRRAFLQALFLCCGSASIPVDSEAEALAEAKHSNYHLELRFSNESFADFVLANFAEVGFRSTARKNSTVLYLKESTRIADFFTFVDAVNARFAVENVIIGRSFRNDANRQLNCIDSNINKAVLAGAKQLDAIQKIRTAGLFEGLPQPLKDVAIAREQNHEANLAEIASVLHISKSGANHRLNKLLEIASEIK